MQASKPATGAYCLQLSRLERWKAGNLLTQSVQLSVSPLPRRVPTKTSSDLEALRLVATHTKSRCTYRLLR
jgi:hypothetical protein